MANGRRWSPLAMTLLVLLEEQSMHAYRMRQLIRERGTEQVVNVDRPNSVYQALDRLARSGLIEVEATTRPENRPERIVYQITEPGHEALFNWLRESLSAPAREFPEFPAALASLPFLAPAEIADLLTRRIAALQERLEALDAGKKVAQDLGLHRVFTLEDEFQRAVTEAELQWVGSVVEDLRDGRLAWTPPSKSE